MAVTYATLADPVDAVVSLLNSNWSAVASGVGTTPTDQSDKLRRWYRYVLNCEITSYEVVN